MKNNLTKTIFSKTSVFLFTLLIFCLFTSLAHAMTPSISVSGLGDGDSVQVNVTGDPNQSVILFYTKTGTGSTLTSLGNTNTNGTLSTTISSSQYGIVSSSLVYVSTGSISGPQSSQVTWPIVNTGTNATTVTLNQGGLVLQVGQSQSVTAYNNTSNSLYVSNNSNPSIANININSNQITATGIANGSTVVTICAIGNTTNCPSIYITVQNSNIQPLTFSQNNITIAYGQSIPITVTGGTGSYIILNNSNNNIVSGSISSNLVTVNAISSTTGTSSLTICSSNMSSCGIINVTVGTASSSILSFSQSNPVLSIGQNVTITISGGQSNSSYYVSANSNPNIVGSSITNGVLTLSGYVNGSSTITVCSSLGGCGTIPVTVSYSSNSGSINLSQTTLTITQGQTLTVDVSGGLTPYSLYNIPNIVQASLSGNIITIYGVSVGSSSLGVCSSGGGCTTLSLIVNNIGAVNQPILSQNSVSLSTGQITNISISGANNYYISSNSNNTVASVVINSNTLTISALNIGTTSVSVCQTTGGCTNLFITVTNTATSGTATMTLSPVNQSISIGNNATFLTNTAGFTNPIFSLNDSFLSSTIINSDINNSGNFNWTPSSVDIGVHYITVSASDSYGHSAQAIETITISQASSTTLSDCLTGEMFSTITGAPCTSNTSSTTTTTVTNTNTSTTSSSMFSSELSYKDKSSDVLELQKLLVSLGYLSATPTGYFGSQTLTAVKKLQKANGLTQTGSLGPKTRALLNKKLNTSSSSKQAEIDKIKAQIEQLTNQLNQLES